MNTSPTTAPPLTVPGDDRVAQHLQKLVDEAEALLKATARAGDDRMEATRERLRGEITRLQARLADLGHTAGARLKDVAQRSDEAAHAHPYVAMGLAAAAGLLLGALLARR